MRLPVGPNSVSLGRGKFKRGGGGGGGRVYGA
ncbi:hypothetical protein T03_1085 [Trichinella britovi]|uniref:Uncharacterized protein n=1 Tax=Trichinella britovi TaxID=45882 RepID=A0A0V1AMT2_TRIBR|nr:hypothetical protein T03_1085 [Trichinella britovi]